MRRKDKEITDRPEIDAIIHGSEVCHLALALNDSPYLVTMSFGYDGEAVYLHTDREGKKIEYFEGNNRVCFEFERDVKLQRDADNPCKWSFSFKTVVGYGTIEELLDPEQKEYALNQIMRHYSRKQWQFQNAALARVRTWKIAIHSLKAKGSKE